MFVADERVPVTVDGQDILFIRPKMDFGTMNTVMDALLDEGSRVRRWGAYQMALLTHNLVSWSGPSFAGRECNAVNIGKLDPDEALVQAALAEIVRRNPLGGATSAEKKGGTNAGGPRSPVNG